MTSFHELKIMKAELDLLLSQKDEAIQHFTNTISLLQKQIQIQSKQQAIQEALWNDRIASKQAEIAALEVVPNQEV